MEESFGKYTLIHRLGGGGMAEVFRARLSGPAGFEKQLALKLILPHFSDDPEFVRMFIHEATLAARLDHANIVRIHEFDQVGGRYYIAMELVDGKDLRTVLARSREVGQPLSVSQAVLIAVEICRALAFAHGELVADAPVVIHRDISPHNAILSQAGEVKITDFGIAKLASAASLTRTGTVKGKLAYMSPEQARGQSLDPRSDLFSAGCVLWEMLTAQRLFAGPNELATLDNLRAAPIQPPSIHNPQVGPELDELVLSALERDPQQRIDSASTMLRGLEEILTGLEGVDRSTGLAKLFQSLFGSQPKRLGTAVMPSPQDAPPDAPTGDEPTAEGIEPIGPEAQTQVDERLEAARPKPLAQPAHKRTFPRWWLVGLFLLPVAAAFGIMAVVVSWVSRPEPDLPVPQAVIDPAAARPADPPADPADPEAPGKATDSAEPASGGAPAEAPDLPADPAPRADKAPRFGRLSVNAIPWAKVYLRKKLLGDTPLERERLAAGWYVLTLVNDDLQVVRNIKIRIRPGQLTTEVVDLRPAAP